MKKACIGLFLIFLASLSVSAQWKSDGKPQPDADDRKSLNGFGAQLVVMKNPRDFMQEWLKPETPHIEPARKVKPGETVGVFVFFAGCKQDDKGNCNSEVDYTIYNPDGSTKGVRVGQPLWKEQPPPVPNIQMGKAILMFALDKDAPTGDYKVRARVSDLNAKISFELNTGFTLK